MGRRTVLMMVAILVAALGSTLVFLYVQGINDRAIADQEPVQVLTATEAIAPGESIEDAQAAGKLDLTEVPLANVLPGAMAATEGLSGQLALTTIYAGEQILPDKFGATAALDQALTIPKDKIAISVQLTDPNRVAGFVTPGSKVAVFVVAVAGGETAVGGKPAPSYVRLLLPDVEVIGVGQTTVLSTTMTDETGAQTTEEIPKAILTLALSQADSERVLFAQTTGELAFGLQSDLSSVEPGPGTGSADLWPTR